MWNEVYDQQGVVNRVHLKNINGIEIHSPHFPPTLKEMLTQDFSNAYTPGGRPLMKEKYTIKVFKNEISTLIAKNGYDPVHVAKYASKAFFSHQADMDLDLREQLLDLMRMEDGPEFEMTEEEFNKFLNKSSEGKI